MDMDMDRIVRERSSFRLIIGACLASVFALALMAFTPAQAQAADMYRMYNPNSGEHFYTANAAERNELYVTGWEYEGIGWVAPDAGDPVFRLYNPNAGDHHYTPNAAERDSLVAVGWNDEGVGWNTGGSVALYRQYNPNAVTGSHNFTTSMAENDSLVSSGWQEEGIGWYGEAAGCADSIPADVAQRRRAAIQAAAAQQAQQSSSASQGSQAEQADVVYVTRTGKSFHRSSCRSTSGKDTTTMSRSTAEAAGYSPCKNCKP